MIYNDNIIGIPILTTNDDMYTHPWISIGGIDGKLKSLNCLNSFALNKLATKDYQGGKDYCMLFSLKYFATIAIHCPPYSFPGRNTHLHHHATSTPGK